MSNISLVERQIKANEFQNRLVAELADISYRAFNSERQASRGFAEGIVPLGQMPFEDKPIDAITKEMIQDYQEEQLKPKYKDVFGNDVSYLL